MCSDLKVIQFIRNLTELFSFSRTIQNNHLKNHKTLLRSDLKNSKEKSVLMDARFITINLRTTHK